LKFLLRKEFKVSCFSDEEILYNSEGDSAEKLCSDNIAEHVDLKWQLSSTEINGTASLRGISLSATMLDLVTGELMLLLLSLRNLTELCIHQQLRQSNGTSR